MFIVCCMCRYAYTSLDTRENPIINVKQVICMYNIYIYIFMINLIVMGWQVAFTTLYEIDGDRKDLEHKYYGLSIQ